VDADAVWDKRGTLDGGRASGVTVPPMDASAWISAVAAAIALIALGATVVQARHAGRQATSAEVQASEAARQTALAERQAGEAARQTEVQESIRRESAQPYVWADLLPDDRSTFAIHLVVKNEGPTAARDVRVEFDPLWSPQTFALNRAPMATFSAHTASPPPPSRTPADSRASSRHALIAPRTTSARGPPAWAAPRTRTHRSIPAPSTPARASRLPRTVPYPTPASAAEAAFPRSPRTSSAFQSARSRVLDTTYFLAASIVRAKGSIQGSIQSGLAPVRAGGRHAASIIS
jgi:hypothetical protein